MTDERMPDDSADQIEDLDVAPDEGENVKGGITDGTSNTVLFSEVVIRKTTPNVVGN